MIAPAIIQIGALALTELIRFVQTNAALRDASTEEVLAQWAATSSEAKRVTTEWFSMQQQPPSPDA